MNYHEEMFRDPKDFHLIDHLKDYLRSHIVFKFSRIEIQHNVTLWLISTRYELDDPSWFFRDIAIAEFTFRMWYKDQDYSEKQKEILRLPCYPNSESELHSLINMLYVSAELKPTNI